MTLGFLVWCLRPVPWSVLVVPVAWSVIAMAVAVPFGIAEDFALPVAAALALGTLLRPSRRVPRVASSGRRPFQLGF